MLGMLMVFGLPVSSQIETWSNLNFPYDTTFTTGNTDGLYFSNNLDKLIVNGNVTYYDSAFEDAVNTHFYPYFDGEEWGSVQECLYTSGLYFNKITDYKLGVVTSGPICSADSIIYGPTYIDADFQMHNIGEADETITLLKVIQDTLYMGGIFQTIDGDSISYLAKYDGLNWTPAFEALPNFINGFPGFLRTLDYYQGDWYLGGNFNATEGDDFLVLKNGVWQPVVGEDGTVITGAWTGLYCSALYNGQLVVGGGLMQSQGNLGHGLQCWDGANWHEIGNSVQSINQMPFYSQINEMIVDAENLYIIGGFYYAGYSPAKFLARWDGSQWCGLQTESLEFPFQYFAIMDGKAVVRTSFNQQVPYGTYMHDGVSFYPCSESVSIPENPKNETTIFLYPNPVDEDVVHLKASRDISGASITVFDITGQLVSVATLQANQNNIDVSHLSPGMYVLQVMNGNEKLGAKKLVVN